VTPKLLSFFVAFVAMVARLHAEVAQDALSAGLLTHQEQASALGEVTKSEKLAWMRSQVREGQYGQRGLDSLFKNFEGKGFIEPTIPGVTKNLRTLNSLSAQQAKGAARTLLFAIKAYQDPRFQLVAVDQPVTASYGRTDKDLVLRYRQTGQRSRIEVKDVKPDSQRADLERIKGQIYKMAAEYKRTGELQAWANRQETIPAIKEYAKQKGVPVYERTKQQSFTKILDDLDNRSVFETRIAAIKWLGRAGTVGIVAYEAYVIQGALSGRLSEREFVATQSAIVGGAGGAWAGAETGSGIGTLLVGGPEDPLAVIAAPAGALVGGIAGAIIGGKAGENIVTGIYGHLDEKQRQKVDTYIYQNYGVSR
jgi:hypothetical protein